MSSILFIRHAETDLAGAFCGHSDPPINARGEQQVADLIAHLGPRPFAKIYSSDLRRAHETAQLLAAPSATPIETTPHLREIHFGDWEGLTWSAIELRDQAFAQRWIADFPTLTPPGGEPYLHFKARILAEVDRIRSLSAGHTVAVVTHAGVLRIVLQTLFACSDRQAWELTKPFCAAFLYKGPGAPPELNPSTPATPQETHP